MEREDHLFLVYFFYGLSFLVLGVLVLAQNAHHTSEDRDDEAPTTPTAVLLDNLWFLGMFALLHGLNEWVDMSLMSDAWVKIEGAMEVVSSFLYAMSSLCLFEFGISLVTATRPRIQWLRWLPPCAFLLWLTTLLVGAMLHLPLPTLEARGWVRYCLGLTGGLLTGFALLTQNQLGEAPSDRPADAREKQRTGLWADGGTGERLRKLLVIAAIFFAINAFLSTVLAAESSLGALTEGAGRGVLQGLFHRLGVTSPLTLFRALCAVVISFSLVSALVAIDREQNRRIAANQRELEAAYENLRVSYERLRETQQHLVQSEKMSAVGTLVSGIAHEFNNLLCGLKGYTQLARGSDDLTQIKADLAQIEDTADRAGEITRTLLTWVRPDRRRLETVDPNEVLRNAVALVHTTRAGRNLEIETQFETLPRLPLSKSDMQNVTMSLLLNAIQAIPEEREGRITVRARLRQDQHVELTVVDNGVGIASENLDKIFLPFFTTKGAQGGSTTPGVGLGLYVVYGIVKNAGGEVRVTSEAESGTTLTLILPAGDSPWRDPATSDNPDADDVETLLAAMRVLVVEPQRAMREVMLGSLQSRAQEVRGAASGREALEALATSGYDLIFVDTMMPGISGIETMRRIHELDARIPVVMMSPTPDPGTRGDMLERGATGLVRVPFESSELADVVRRADRRRRARATTA
ncbi:MAG: response regulator [Proteobacteria bacterium]|nr:response regulator [Pseudomonadota bacterium]